MAALSSLGFAMQSRKFNGKLVEMRMAKRKSRYFG